MLAWKLPHPIIRTSFALLGDHLNILLFSFAARWGSVTAPWYGERIGERERSRGAEAGVVLLPKQTKGCHGCYLCDGLRPWCQALAKNYKSDRSKGQQLISLACLAECASLCAFNSAACCFISVADILFSKKSYNLSFHTKGWISFKKKLQS